MYYILRILQITFSDSWKVIQVAVQKVIQLVVRKRQSAIQFEKLEEDRGNHKADEHQAGKDGREQTSE